ncbi:Protein of unknown function DUF1376 [uncultured Caudovirales phage]|uniref:DUF1376 domain-containing protein n=1 Tax=uncultured Caudovirales phage TaxID=2100421 RepID=A0A6J5LKR1_9CAUD|nr:Protein of unknown function DUF1376 [uncultured Caudovirales phage]
MHYYQFNIGDYVSHTRHLSPIEDIAYRRLLDAYYLSERPLNSNLTSVARQIGMREHEEEVGLVLQEFFVLGEDGWTSNRADKEIAHYHSKIEQASKAGRASAERRSNARSTDVQPTNNQEPITKNQEPIIKEGKPSLSTAKLMACPQKEILNLWAKHLPHLAQPRSWEGTRRANTKQRWIQASKPSAYSPDGYQTEEDGIKWWDSFFGYIAKDTSLSSGFESQGRTWRPDLEWVVNATNFQKIIDGKYSK